MFAATPLGAERLLLSDLAVRRRVESGNPRAAHRRGQRKALLADARKARPLPRVAAMAARKLRLG
eukprot:13678993-Alexandrium_andersonii.AAC.1